MSNPDNIKKSDLPKDEDIDAIYNELNEEIDNSYKIQKLRKSDLAQQFYQEGDKYLLEIEERNKRKSSVFSKLLHFLMDW